MSSSAQTKPVQTRSRNNKDKWQMDGHEADMSATASEPETDSSSSDESTYGDVALARLARQGVISRHARHLQKASQHLVLPSVLARRF